MKIISLLKTLWETNSEVTFFVDKNGGGVKVSKKVGNKVYECDFTFPNFFCEENCNNTFDEELQYAIEKLDKHIKNNPQDNDIPQVVQVLK